MQEEVISGVGGTRSGPDVNVARIHKARERLKPLLGTMTLAVAFANLSDARLEGHLPEARADVVPRVLAADRSGARPRPRGGSA